MNMNDIRRVRYNSIRLNRNRGKSESAQSQSDVRRLQFKRSPQEEYTFEEGQILLNGVDVLNLLDGDRVEVGFWAGLAGAVDEYRKNVWLKYGTDWREFNGKTQALLDKLLNKLTHAYEEMTGGIRVQMHGERLWLNDIDPKVVLNLFLSNPTTERRRYLESFKTKLALILEGKVGYSHSHAVLEESRRVFYQIHQALENTPSADSTPLLAAVNNLDR
ncbi:MAG: hypothetical protein A3F82_00790 [Deltaproteobacteria bacterium RIFCSPLOWO2_12_FULL_44_12]|nr:MAG: hypothetical protein A2712_04165 [Deltaproteobacteria bacterium RIFCSPHIGHO2_01_FULL_43_49]OGQ16380.1 MAG: hypothetical protein A3D22_02135 [Deltaproteobacteria bacterium RIFCSPHIGHO2_02_FULL_44_53]OGQ27794.1 MAG: hypothetical protein A3D98_08855 [Deltaproteobacteria bacterium RIFCSPHIGHO2_12_FULL_44_21]OGQ32898.1 MAG: hypothetical protein A2979_10065 [Deltaproteobacteria bacterium RIFCSPLOWO2_01_FULL_45_74]OGQ41999.1 MAG: hypothetical protein A3I70_09850 [Deltaproteobacteria bacterium 